MSSIHPAVQQTLAAKQNATDQQVQISLLKKQLDTQKASGEAIVDLLAENVDIQKQISAGHLDVRA